MECVIDELKICYKANKERLEPLMDVEAGGRYDIPDFHLFRIIHDRFRFCFDVVRRKEKVAQLRFGFYTEDADDCEKYVFLKIMNPVLYDQTLLRQVLTVPDFFGMTINNFTALDVAVDTQVNVPSLIKKMMRDKSITTIINGKAIKDRKAIMPEIFYEYSTSLDRLRNPTITIKQKKAIANKNEGLTVQAYDKRAEILNHSGKQYVLDYHNNPKRLYRLEVRLRYRELSDYLRLIKSPAMTEQLFSQQFLINIFIYHLASVIRFTKGRRKISWRELLEGNGRV